VSRVKIVSLGLLVATVAAVGWLSWRMHLPHAILTRFWPIETYYAVHAEFDLDGRPYTLEGVGRCDWQWRFALDINSHRGRSSHHGGVLAKVLDDGRAVIFFPGHYCEGARPGVINHRGVFFKEIDLLTGDVRYPERQHREPSYVRRELPVVAVLDDARAPKTIRFYPAPKAHSTSDCASLRFRSYRVTVTSSGAVTQQERSIPYLTNLARQDRWAGYAASVVPFSTLEKFTWLKDALDRPPPAFTSFDSIDAVKVRRDWRRELQLDRVRPREIAWDRNHLSVTLPPAFVGNCADVTTLYPATAAAPSRGLVIRSGSDVIPQANLSATGFVIDPADRILISVQGYYPAFSPRMFEPSS
jgi:hypothetical protein